MSKEIYVLKSQVHFGSLKTSVPKGTRIIVDRKKKTVEINGVSHDNLTEIEMGIRANYIIPYVEGETEIDSTVKVLPKTQEKLDKKMEVHKSDLDTMPNEIDISDTKKEVRDAKRKQEKKMTVSYEKHDDVESRGLKVVSNEATGFKADTQQEIMQVVNGDDNYRKVSDIKPKTAAKKPFGLATTEDAKDDVAAQINGEGTVVARIGKGEAETKSVGSGRALVAKRPKEGGAGAEKAQAAAEARKKSIAAKRAKGTN